MDCFHLEDKGNLFSETARTTHSTTLNNIPEDLCRPCVNRLVCVMATQFVLRMVGNELLSRFVLPRTNYELSTVFGLSRA